MIETVQAHWDKIFWVLFVVAVLAFGAMTSGLVGFQILAGFVIISIGAAKISQEMLSKKTMSYHGDLYDKFYELSRQLERTVDITMGMKGKSERRFYSSDRKRIETDMKLENNFRLLAKKIIDIENKLSKMTKEMQKKNLQRK